MGTTTDTRQEICIAKPENCIASRGPKFTDALLAVPPKMTYFNRKCTASLDLDKTEQPMHAQNSRCTPQGKPNLCQGETPSIFQVREGTASATVDRHDHPSPPLPGRYGFPRYPSKPTPPGSRLGSERASFRTSQKVLVATLRTPTHPPTPHTINLFNAFNLFNLLNKLNNKINKLTS